MKQSLEEYFAERTPSQQTAILHEMFCDGNEAEAFELLRSLPRREQEEVIPSVMRVGVDDDVKIDGEINEARLYGDYA